MELTLFNSRQHQQRQLSASTISLGCDPMKVDWVIDDPRISGIQLTAELILVDGSSRVRIFNHGSTVILQSGRRIHGGASYDIEPGSFFWAGETCFSITPTLPVPADEILTTLPSFATALPREELASVLGQSPASATLVHWLQSIGKLQRSVGGSKKLFGDAAHAAFDPGGLDCGMIITLEQGEPRIADSFVTNPELGIAFDRDVVDYCRQLRQTVFHQVKDSDNQSDSLPYAVVASPIFDHDNEVIGVVYGSRCRARSDFRKGIRPLEAQFVQVIAECVTAGMFRLAQEAEAARTRVQFEQVFSPKLVETLQRDPDLLRGHEREVTVLFCDMQGSSAITSRLRPRDLYHFFGDVMDFLTQFVNSNDGVVIDYYGDGLAAFWNAPMEQADHAGLAVKTGLEILDALPDLNAGWRNQLGRNVQLGIGINTGKALVGNSGSRHRMKYGPRGTSVNVAARIESETRRFGIPLLISSSTAEKTGQQFITRRVFQTPLKGLVGTHDLFQPHSPQMDVRDLERLRAYEKALTFFESQHYVDALEKLVELEVEEAMDPATEFLLRRTRDAISKSPAGQVSIKQSNSIHKSD